MLKKILSIFFLLILSASAFSQTGNDTTFSKAALQNSIAVYGKHISEQTNLYNGYQYVRPNQTNDEEHPYFETDDWVFGSVEYDGEIFKNIPLLYDIRSDKVITEHYLNGNEMELIPEKLSGFTMAKHSFKKIKNEEVSNSLPQTGYYEILYDGVTRAIVLQKKTSLKTISSNEVQILYEKRIKYYILKNGKFFQVRSKGSLLKLLSDEKKALKQFLTTHKLRFRGNAESVIAQTAEFYDTLKTK